MYCQAQPKPKLIQAGMASRPVSPPEKVFSMKTSQPWKLKFCMQPQFNPTGLKLEKKGPALASYFATFRYSSASSCRILMGKKLKKLCTQLEPILFRDPNFWIH